jgi:hypothetical protein
MFERFTDRARRVVVLAQEEARTLNHNYIGTEHILLGLIHEGEGVAAKALESLGISLDAVRQQVGEDIGQGQQVGEDIGQGQQVGEDIGQGQQVGEDIGQGQQAPSGHIPFTPRAKKVLELSLREALQLGHNYIGTEHILLGLIREGDGVAAQVLVKLGADLNRVRQQVIQLLHGYQGKEPAASGTAAESAPSTSLVLDQFGRNLTQDAREGKLDPVIGREKEVERVMQVLSRRTKTNPVLVGEPGVDKTAVVEGLAQKIVKGEVPEVLRGKQLYLLDFETLIIESRYGDDFPRQLKEAMNEVRVHGEIILFVNELHMLIGVGASDTVVGARSVIEPMLARDELQIIGATTLDEYRKYLERDPVLGRRFQSVQVAEPTVAHTIEILKGVRDRYESHHKISITDGALVAAARLADRYISDRFLPDKAIDLIDEIGSQMLVDGMTAPPDLREADEQIAQVRRDKESAIDSQDFEKAAALRDTEKQLLARKTSLEKSWKAGDLYVVAEVDDRAVFAAVARIMGISMARLYELEANEPVDMAASESDDSDDSNAYRLLNDQPADEGESDLLGTADIASGIASMLVSSRDEAPFVMAIDGAWGRGKSTLLRQIDSELSSYPEIIRVRFNAWIAKDSSALEGLIKSVLCELDSSVIRRRLRHLGKRKHLITAAGIGAAIAARLFGVSRLVDELWKQLAIDAKSRNEMRELIHSMLSDWMQRDDAKHSRRAMVVFVDDLDRCSDDVVVKVCEAVKLYLDGPGMIFVVACDLSVLARSASTTARGGMSEGRAYLEKIVQVAYRVPPPEEKQIEKLIAGYGQRSRTSVLIDDTVTKILVERSSRNPRRIKRIINSFVLEYQLNSAWQHPPLDSSHLVTTILLQHLYAPFYEYLADEESGEDPIGDFLDYAKVRARISSPPGPNDAWWSLIRRTFQKQGIPAPDRMVSTFDTLNVDIERLERRFPAEFPMLAESDAFLALLAGVGGKDARKVLRAQLVSRPQGVQEELDKLD